MLVFAHAAFAQLPPLTILSTENSYDVQADGSYINLYRVEIRPANDAAARRQGQQAFAYSPHLEDLDIVEAYTRKADGRVLHVDPGSIHEQLPPGTADRALITDNREKVLVFPDVAGGDTLGYTLRRTVRHPSLDGRFMLSLYVSRGTPLLSYDLTVRAPRGLALRVETHDLEYDETVDAATVVRHWHAAVPFANEEAAAVGPYDRLPRVFVSSEPDYAAFAADYAALALPHARVTPAVQSLADRIAGGTADRREQARLLYEWVSGHIRYVAVYLAAGALEPHDAADVLAHGWGDCKDHAVLLQALLAARGIAAELAMINLGTHYSLSEPPTFAQLNHAITYLPDWDLYVDSTAAMAPFATLPFGEYGKPVVHATALGMASGPALRHTPQLPAGVASMALHTDALLADDGRITGTTTTTATGPFAIELRRDAAWIEATGDGAAASQLRALGTDGSGAFSFAAPDRLGDSYTISGDFALEARPELLDGDSFTPPDGLRLLARVGDELIGPLGQRALKDTQPTPCFPGREVAEVSLTLPPGRHLLRLPREVRIDTEAVQFHSTWTQHAATVTHTSELVSRVGGALCTGEVRRMAALALESVRRAQRMQVALSDE